MSYQLPQLVDPSWQGIASYLTDLSANAPSPWREHFAAELAVIQPTLRALGIDGSAPPPLKLNAVVQPPPVLDGPDVHNPPVRIKTTTGGELPVHVFSTEPQVGPLSADQGLQLAVEVGRQLMKDFGFTPAQAAGIVGNLYHESAFMNANVNEFGWRYPEGDERNYGQPFDNPYGYGWAQWSADRKQAYVAFCHANGLNPASPAANYAFLVHELKTTESGTVPAILATQSPDEAAVVFRKVFERAAMPVDDKRVAAAQTLYPSLA